MNSFDRDSPYLTDESWTIGVSDNDDESYLSHSRGIISLLHNPRLDVLEFGVRLSLCTRSS